MSHHLPAGEAAHTLGRHVSVSTARKWMFLRVCNCTLNAGSIVENKMSGHPYCTTAGLDIFFLTDSQKYPTVKLQF